MLDEELLLQLQLELWLLEQLEERLHELDEEWLELELDEIEQEEDEDEEYEELKKNK